MKLYNISNHVLTSEQVEDSMKRLAVQEIIELPEDIKKEFGNVTPDKINDIAKKIIDFVTKDNRNEEVIVHLAGQPALVVLLVNCFASINIKTIYSFSERKSVETINGDGTVVKTNVFKHQGWYEYPTVFDAKKLIG